MVIKFQTLKEKIDFLLSRKQEIIRSTSTDVDSFNIEGICLERRLIKEWHLWWKTTRFVYNLTVNFTPMYLWYNDYPKLYELLYIAHAAQLEKKRITREQKAVDFLHNTSTI